MKWRVYVGESIWLKKKLENHEKLHPNNEGQPLDPDEELLLKDLEEIIEELEELQKKQSQNEDK